MTTIVFATDPHLSDRPPASRSDDWAGTILGKFSQVGEICREVGADASIWGGDIFHLKQPDMTSHRLVNRLATVLARYPCERWSCVGNHDCKFADYKFLPDQPLETLFASGVLNRLYDDYEGEIWSGDHSDPVVRVVGIPYHGTRYNFDRIRKIKKGAEDFLVCVAHILASPKMMSMFGSEDVVRYDQLVDLAPDVDVWIFGHWHKNQGVKEVLGKTIINIGSLSRGSLVEDEMSRIPECAVLKFSDTVTVSRRKLDVLPAEKVFDVEKRIAVESYNTTMETFVDKLQATINERRSGDLIDVVRSMEGVPDLVMEKTLSFLEEAKEEISKAGR